MAYRREDYVRGTLLPQARFDCSITVCLFSNETKDDSINPKQIEIIKFRKKAPERVCSGIYFCKILAFWVK